MVTEMKSVTVQNTPHFNVLRTFDCGQCFRFSEDGEGGTEGVALGKYIKIKQSESETKIYGIDEDEYEERFKAFLGLDEDYGKIQDDIGSHFGVYNNTIYEAMRVSDGIHILRQDKWETLCSFIVSQNNNIPRIKKIISRMCERFGEAFTYDGKTYHKFPTPRALSEAGEEEIFSLGTGFRAKYIYDAANKCASGEISIAEIEKMDDVTAAQTLMKICGVGPKVAACALLYGFHRTAAFPIDVWVKRIIERYYSGGIDISSLGAYAGIAQQYLFYYERYVNGGKK